MLDHCKENFDTSWISFLSFGGPLTVPNDSLDIHIEEHSENKCCRRSKRISLFHPVAVPGLCVFGCKKATHCL